MAFIFPEFEKKRYQSIIDKNIDWLEINFDEEYTHIHSNGLIEDKQEYLKNINSDNIDFQEMKPLKCMVKEKGSFIFITGLSNFKLIYFEEFLDLKLAYHSIWHKGLSPKCYSWHATKV